jgi:GNAT superfamily N-acetyltransferase
MINIKQAEIDREIEQVRTLFREYESWLALDLCFQNFEAELKNLPGAYAAPEGRLLLAEADGESAGCVALRGIESGVCEMKRLFVRDDFRGLGLGKLLIERLIKEASAIGYRKMRLDTLPDRMPRAVKLYEFYGFRAIEPYYETPHSETLFMEKFLKV